MTLGTKRIQGRHGTILILRDMRYLLVFSGIVKCG